MASLFLVILPGLVRRRRRERFTLAQHAPDASQQHSRHHQATNLVASTLTGSFIGRTVTRYVPRPHRRLDQVMPQMAIRAAAADSSMTPRFVRLINCSGHLKRLIGPMRATIEVAAITPMP